MKNKFLNEKKIWREKFDSFFLEGKDRENFLNGITTSNLINNSEELVRTCWLSPTGILKGLLEIYKDSDKLLILILQGDIKEVKSYFEDIIFPFDNVNLSENFSTFRTQEIDYINSWRHYQPSISMNETLQKSSDNLYKNYINDADLEEWKIDQAIPILDNINNKKNNPLELGLTDLIEFNKGCYLGQETMAKLKNVSSLKQEIRIWKSNKRSNKNFLIKNKNVYLNEKKETIVGNITYSYLLKDLSIKGLLMIKRNFLDKNKLFCEDIGTININKSVSTVFL